MTFQPILSVCVPTFNRKNIIKKTIEMLLEETESLRLSGLVELVISDNASTDGAWLVVEEYESTFGVTIHRSEKNLGIAANIIKCADVASGKYLWFFGDDDVVTHEFIRDVVTLFEVSRYSILVIPYIDFSSTSEIDSSRRALAIEDLEIKNSQELIKIHDRYLGFITSCIYNAKEFRKVLSESNLLLGNNYLTKYISYRLVLEGSPARLSSGVVYKRCTQGSHFVKNNSILIKTFIYDQAAIAKLLAGINRSLASCLLGGYLNNARLFYYLKRDGVDFREVLVSLRALGVPVRNLWMIFVFHVLPLSLVELAGFAYLLMRKAKQKLSYVF